MDLSTDTVPSIWPLICVGEGRHAEVFVWDERTVFRRSKVPNESQIDRASAAITAARDVGAPVPQFCARHEFAGQSGLAIERLESDHLMTHLERKPWRVAAIGRVMGLIHAHLHAVRAPRGLPSISELVGERLRVTGAAGSRTQRILSAVRALPGGETLCHGDLNPDNIMRRSSTGEWIAVDWGDAARGAAAADIAATLVMISDGRIPSNVSPTYKVLAPLGRCVLALSYRQAYALHRPIDAGIVLQWMRVWRALRSLEQGEAGTRLPSRNKATRSSPVATAAAAKRL